MPDSTHQAPKEIFSYKLNFTGKGSEYLGVLMVNWFLSFFTLGFYYPWSEVKRLRYLYGNTSLDGNRFHFSGNISVHEILFGFLKVISLYAFFFGSILLLEVLTPSIFVSIAIILLYVVLLVLLPFMIHGSFRYRMSRSSYRGIRFGYRGNCWTLVVKFLKGLLFTFLTLGLYGPWFEVDMLRYTLGNVRFGDTQFSYNGRGTILFLLFFKGFFLTLITFGGYSFWWFSNLFSFFVDNLYVKKGEEYIKFESTATPGRFLKLIFRNTMIFVFTLGIGTAWAKMRTHRFIANNIKMEGTLDLSCIHQTEEYNDALDEDISDFFDLVML